MLAAIAAVVVAISIGFLIYLRLKRPKVIESSEPVTDTAVSRPSRVEDLTATVSPRTAAEAREKTLPQPGTRANDEAEDPALSFHYNAPENQPSTQAGPSCVRV